MRFEPPTRPSLEDKVENLLDEDEDYREFDALLVCDIWIEDLRDRLGTESDSVSFAESSETYPPDSIVRKRREFVNHDEKVNSDGTDTDLEIRILNHVGTVQKLADDYVQLVLSIWMEEMKENYGVVVLRDLSDKQKKSLTPPESITGGFRKLKREGLVSSSGEVEKARLRNEERFRDYYG